MSQIHPIRRADEAHILALNNAHAVETSWLDEARLKSMLDEAFLATRIGDVDALPESDRVNLHILEVVIERGRIQCRSPVQPLRFSAQLVCRDVLRCKLVEPAAAGSRHQAAALETGGNPSVQHQVVAGFVFQIQAP